MLATTLTAMVINVVQFFNQGSYLLLAVGGIVLFLAIWLVFRRHLAFHSRPRAGDRRRERCAWLSFKLI